MRITIIKPDNIIGVDGIFHQVDCSSLPGNLRVVQWSGSGGHIEWIDGPNTDINDIGPYQVVIDKWVETKARFDAQTADPYYGMTDEHRLSVVKKKKKSDIVAEFVKESKKPVDVNGLKFDGGLDSFDKLEKAIQFAKRVGKIERKFYEIDETPHILPVSGDGLTGESILIAVGTVYDSLDGKMRALVRSVNRATSVEEVGAIDILWV